MDCINKLKFFIAKHHCRYKLYKMLKNFTRTSQLYVLLNVPSHGNLGDHLISLAEKRFLQDYKHKNPLVISTGQLLYGFDIVQRFIQPNDVLLITGGGYLGSIWAEEENRICKIISSFPNNKIVILPQTIYYGNDAESNSLFEYATKIYKSHPNLYITGREKSTITVLLNEMKMPTDKVMLLPDMALYLNYSEDICQREGILFCMRSDKEQINNHDIIDTLRRSFSSKYQIAFIDTQAPYSISQDRSELEIKNLIHKFKCAKLVITDRLHGMIYATITGTPVIALNNKSGKIKNVYDCWLKDVPYVRYVDEEMASNLKYTIDELLSMSDLKFDNTSIKRQFNQLSSIL